MTTATSYMGRLGINIIFPSWGGGFYQEIRWIRIYVSEIKYIDWIGSYGQEIKFISILFSFILDSFEEIQFFDWEAFLFLFVFFISYCPKAISVFFAPNIIFLNNRPTSISIFDDTYFRHSVNSKIYSKWCFILSSALAALFVL